MRLQGKITRWDDEKGFGFISGHGDGSTVFVHIKAFPRASRRPEVRDVVSYQVAKGKGGKPKAEKVRFSDQTQPRKKPAGRHQDSSLPGLFAVLFVCFLLVAAYLGRISWLVVLAYFVLGLVTFSVYAWDKSSARLGRWRTKESSLHLLELIGGWPGALIAQRLLRHKSSKQRFLAVFWLTVLLNVATVGYLAWAGDASSINQLIDEVWRYAARQMAVVGG